MVFGAGGGTNSYQEIEEADVILLWGSNARETHPIFFHHLLKGVRNGARLYGIDPRRLPGFFPRWNPHVPAPLTGGLYAISASTFPSESRKSASHSS